MLLLLLLAALTALKILNNFTRIKEIRKIDKDSTQKKKEKYILREKVRIVYLARKRMEKRVDQFPGKTEKLGPVGIRERWDRRFGGKERGTEEITKTRR